jgi:hypothetical protein
VTYQEFSYVIEPLEQCVNIRIPSNVGIPGQKAKISVLYPQLVKR